MGKKNSNHTITLSKHAVNHVISGYIEVQTEQGVGRKEIVAALLRVLTRAELEALGYAEFISDLFDDNGEFANQSPLIKFEHGICPVCGNTVEYGKKIANNECDADFGYLQKFTCTCGTEGLEGYGKTAAFDGTRYILKHGNPNKNN